MGSLEIDLDVTNGTLPPVATISKAALSELASPANVNIPETKPSFKDKLEELVWQQKLSKYSPRREE
jgi:hypothetical protein